MIARSHNNLRDNDNDGSNIILLIWVGGIAIIR